MLKLTVDSKYRKSIVNHQQEKFTFSYYHYILLFEEYLNVLAKPFGIQFSDAQIGKSVNFLDVTLYIDETGHIQHRLFRKETDSRQYLHTSSFHPPSVFRSVAFSQMLRIVSRNSTDEHCVSDMSELKEDLIRCGHKDSVLEELEPLAVQRAIEKESNNFSKISTNKSTSTLVYTTKYFKEVQTLKDLVKNMESDIRHLCGEVRIIFALKKNFSIANRVVKNRMLSEIPSTSSDNPPCSQSCKGKNCKLCPLLYKLDEDIVINDRKLVLNSKLTCKNRDCIYVATCKLCDSSNSYFGQTVTAANTRFNGHRSHFKLDSNKSYEGSALSQHCFDFHTEDEMNLENFNIGIVKVCNAENLDREEDRFINKFRTNIWGLNRMRVVE